MMGMRCDRLRITDTTIASINHPNPTTLLPQLQHPQPRPGDEGERRGERIKGGDNIPCEKKRDFSESGMGSCRVRRGD